LKRLSRFQEVTNLLIKEEAVKTHGDADKTLVPLPSGYSDLNVADKALIMTVKTNFAVYYPLRDSNALSHRGYVYRSDDDAAAFELQKTGYTRVTPHWFFYSK